MNELEFNQFVPRQQGVDVDTQPGECIAITPVEQSGFTGFGPSLVSRSARRATGHLQFERNLASARQQIRQQVPVCPGVYGWLNADRTLTYIGKSKSLRHRLASYFAKQTTDPKMARIRRESRMIVWEPLSHELLALIREQELIDRWRPPYNVEGKPERRQPGFVCVSRGSAPNLFFARQVPKRAAVSFGPIAGRAKLGEVIATMNYVFQLRDCPDRTKMHFSNQLQLFENERHAQCLRFELTSCPGPCAGSCSREGYQHNVDKAVRFLRGSDKSMLDRLQERMNQAADSRAYERAGVLRDRLDHMQWMHRRIKQLRTARRRLNGVWTLPGFDQQQLWVVLRSGQLIACTQGDSDPRTGQVVQDAADREPGVPKTNLGINLLLLLASWIKKYPDQAKSIVPIDEIRLPHQRARSA